MRNTLYNPCCSKLVLQGVSFSLPLTTAAITGYTRKFKVGITQSVQRLTTSWTVQGSSPGGSDIFRTRTDRPWDPPSLLYNGYRLSFPGLKRPGRGVDHPPSSNAKVKERVELYLYSPFGPSWPVLGRTLQGDAGFLCNNAVVFGDTIKGTLYLGNHTHIKVSTLYSVFSV